MELAKAAKPPPFSFLHPTNYCPIKPANTPFPGKKNTLNLTHRKLNLSRRNPRAITKNLEISVPAMSDIIDSSRAQNLDLELQTLGPFFRITAKSSGTQRELGRAEGVIRVWFGGKILHLDSMRLQRERRSGWRNQYLGSACLSGLRRLGTATNLVATEPSCLPLMTLIFTIQSL